jgi:hypothetical protein
MLAGVAYDQCFNRQRMEWGILIEGNQAGSKVKLVAGLSRTYVSGWIKAIQPVLEM